MVVSAGKVVGTEIRHNDNLVMFFLRHRRGGRYSAQVGPGDPLYERIRGEVLAELRAHAAREEAQVRASLNAKIDQMRAREAAAARLLEDPAGAAESDPAAEWQG